MSTYELLWGVSKVLLYFIGCLETLLLLLVLVLVGGWMDGWMNGWGY